MATLPRTLSQRIDLVPKILLWTLLLVACVWLAFQLSTVLIVIMIALVLVGTLDPLVAWFERRGVPRGRALVLVMVAMTCAVFGLLLLSIPPLIEQFVRVIDEAPAGRDKLVVILGHYAWARPLIQVIQAIPIDDFVGNAGKTMIAYSTSLFSIIGYGISTIFLAIYLLADPLRAKGILYAVVPRHHHLTLARVLLELKVIVGGYMRGQLITSVAIAVFVFTVLTISRVDNALAIAMFAGVTDIIPFVGGYVASAPCIVAVSGEGTATIIIVTILMFAYQEFESRILVPRVYGKVLRLPPAVVLVSLLVGGTLLGIVGALLALPIAAGILMLVRELRVELPGELPEPDSTRVRDERVEHLYEGLSEGASAATAGAIADELVEKLREKEHGQLVTTEFPSMALAIADAQAAKSGDERR
jgi:putative heme transporter